MELGNITNQQINKAIDKWLKYADKKSQRLKNIFNSVVVKMKILNRKVIPGTRERYELHLVEYTNDKTDWEVWSVRSQRHLKDTTSWGSYKGLSRTFGLTFEDEQDTVQRKMYLRDIIKLCGEVI